MSAAWLMALFGGFIIGIAVSLMLWLNGRVTGISGIVNGILAPVKSDTAWRIYFVVGLISGGALMNYFEPGLFSGDASSGNGSIVAAGLLVGFGTLMGSGCTSGHGVCGISRMSLRSIVATLTFISAGIVAVIIFRHFGVLP